MSYTEMDRLLEEELDLHKSMEVLDLMSHREDVTERQNEIAARLRLL